MLAVLETLHRERTGPTVPLRAVLVDLLEHASPAGDPRRALRDSSTSPRRREDFHYEERCAEIGLEDVIVTGRVTRAAYFVSTRSATSRGSIVLTRGSGPATSTSPRADSVYSLSRGVQGQHAVETVGRSPAPHRSHRSRSPTAAQRHDAISSSPVCREICSPSPQALAPERQVAHDADAVYHVPLAVAQ